MKSAPPAALRIVSFCSFLFYTAFLSSQTPVWEKTSFPDSNYVYFISAIGDKTFAGSSQGLFVSGNEGSQWKNLTSAYGISSVNDLLLQDSVYYLSSWASKVWKSTDLVIWESVGDSLPAYVTSLEYFDDKLYASTSNSVYRLNPSTGTWKLDGLKVGISHNDYIGDMMIGPDSTLYASGCDYLYYKAGGNWQVIDTSYTYCGVKIRNDGSNIFVNTSGSGIQKYGSSGLDISETIIANTLDPYSWSASDFAFNAGEMVVTSQNRLYNQTLDSSEVVCDDLLTSVAFGFDNIFVGTQKRGIWKKGWPFLQGEGSDRNAAVPKASSLGFDLSPTPSEGGIVAKIWMSEDQPAQFTVFDATGKMVLDQKINSSLDLDIRLSVPGLYMAMLSNGKQKFTKRIIIQ